MNNYVDLVLCQHAGNKRLFLFRAPFCSGLNEGDNVIVETSLGEAEAVVRAVQHTAADAGMADFAVKCAGATVPLKRVLKKVVCHELIYEEERNNV